MGVSIKYLLDQEFFSDFEVLAGREGLEREAQGIAVLDAPDAFTWSRGKELIITSGFSIAKEPGCIEKAFRQGYLQKAAGMMIKRGRYLKEIPQDMVKLFEKYGLPLISVPYEIAYMDLMKQLNTIVMNRTIRRFQIQQSGAFSLSNTTYKVQKIRKILQAVEVEMDFPALLYDLEEQKEYYSSANFKRISDKYGLQETDYWNPKQKFSKYILCDYLQMFRIRLVNTEEKEGPRVSWITIPISVGGNLQAYFVVMESREFLDYYDEYSIRIAYLLLQAVYEQIVIAQSIGNIGFENLVLLAMHSRGEDEERLLYQAGQQGISMNTRYACVLFRQTNELVNARNKREIFTTIFQGSSLYKYSKIAFLDENAGVILSEIRESEHGKKENLEEMMLDLCKNLKEKCPEMEMEFAVLREGKKLSELRETIGQCENIMKMGKKLYPDRRIWDYEMIGPLTWLQIPEDELDHMLSQYRDLMKEEKNVELLRTLKIYLENNMNFSVTAEKMYVHINTIRKRIDKLNTLIDIDWNSYMSRLKTEILLQFLEL